ncbi:MAG: hypothetical protein Q4B91_08480 [Atopobiaceae bacterium]|nr:hypothetical protein [Atopobiaceae bacterium]
MEDEKKAEQKFGAKKTALIAAAAVVVVAAIGFWYVNYQIPRNNAVDAYNAAADGLSQRNEELDEAIAILQELMSSEEQAYDASTLDAASSAIGEAQGAECDVPEMPSDTDEIIAAADEIEGMGDYSAQLEALAGAQANLQDSIDQLKQVTNPSEQFVIGRLNGLPNITGVEAATEENDPNGNLHKDGGYTAAVFFSTDLVDQSQVYVDENNTGIPAAGTDGGGCVEVYATVEDAEERNTYLAGFDGSILRPGSHAVVGTCVVRTSDLLTASQQNEMEQNIIDSLIRLD